MSTREASFIVIKRFFWWTLRYWPIREVQIHLSPSRSMAVGMWRLRWINLVSPQQVFLPPDNYPQGIHDVMEDFRKLKLQVTLVDCDQEGCWVDLDDQKENL